MFSAEHSAGNHNGGQIMFGPEGLLYVTLGDNANGANAQDVGNFFGKILRIDPGDPPGEATYSVPESNPVFPEDLKTAIYSIGLRNPYRASFGPSGELIVADVGEGPGRRSTSAADRDSGGDFPRRRRPRLADLRGLLPVAAATAGPDRTRLRVSAQRPLE